MKTARQALADHRATFYQATDCNAWMATEAQLLAQIARENGHGGSAGVEGHDSYARQIILIREEDQFYA